MREGNEKIWWWKSEVKDVVQGKKQTMTVMIKNTTEEIKIKKGD